MIATLVVFSFVFVLRLIWLQAEKKPIYWPKELTWSAVATIILLAMGFLQEYVKDLAGVIN